MIEAARASGATVIQAANIYVYGEGSPETLGPDTPHAAQNPLGRLRIAMEDRLRSAGIPVILLRAGDFIDTEGSGNWFDRVLLAKLAKGRVEYPGNPDIPHAWAYLPDLGRAAVALAERRAALPRVEEVLFPGYTLTGRELIDERPDLFQLRGVMTFSDGSVYPEEGVLDFSDVALRPETGTLQGRFKFPNPEGAKEPGQSYFYPGQFVKIRIKGYIRSNAILIPQRAVQQGTSGSFVYVIDEEEKAELRPIQASAWHSNEWLIEAGLHVGERVVVDGFHRILPGTRVNAIQYQKEKTSSLIHTEEPITHNVS